MWNLVIEWKPNRDKWKNEHTDTGILNSPTFTGRGIQIYQIHLASFNLHFYTFSILEFFLFSLGGNRGHLNPMVTLFPPFFFKERELEVMLNESQY
jgi:hypothetical protein